MPKEKIEEVKAEKPKKNYLLERVPFYAFKDNERYKDDITVGVNGKIFRIQRGKTVMIPRYVYNAIAASQNQDLATANLIEKKEREFLDAQ